MPAARRFLLSPGDADKLIAHQARILRRRASPSTTTGWQNRAATQAGHWRTTSVPYSPWNPMPAPNLAPASVSTTPGSRHQNDLRLRFHRPTQHRPRPDRPTRSRWLARQPRNTVLLGPPGPANTSANSGYRCSPCRAPRRHSPGHRMDHPTRQAHRTQPTRCRTTQDLPLRTHRDRRGRLHPVRHRSSQPVLPARLTR